MVPRWPAWRVERGRCARWPSRRSSRGPRARRSSRRRWRPGWTAARPRLRTRSRRPAPPSRARRSIPWSMPTEGKLPQTRREAPTVAATVHDRVRHPIERVRDRRWPDADHGRHGDGITDPVAGVQHRAALALALASSTERGAANAHDVARPRAVHWAHGRGDAGRPVHRIRGKRFGGTAGLPRGDRRPDERRGEPPSPGRRRRSVIRAGSTAIVLLAAKRAQSEWLTGLSVAARRAT